MPTTRTKRIRGKNNQLLQSEKHLLLTGNCTPPKGDWRDIGESWLRPFTIGREELRALWELHREELLKDWKGKKLPWAAIKFDHIKNGGNTNERT